MKAWHLPRLFTYLIGMTATSNQTMKLTATVLRFGDAFPVATFLSPLISLSPGGLSLSFSR